LKSSPEQAEIDALQTSDHLLKGLLFDDAGHRMIATHATKAGVRHRYYVSKPALHGEARIAKLGSVSRVPPSEIEGTSNLPSANTSSSSNRTDVIPKTMLDNSTLAAFRTCRRERDFWRRRQTVESHSVITGPTPLHRIN